jgi:hypothetical protein
MQEYTINAQSIIYVNCPIKTLGEIFQQAKGDCLDRVHSDLMDLVIPRPHERWSKTFKGELENNS